MLDLRPIKDRLAAATPGPWQVVDLPDQDGTHLVGVPRNWGGHRDADLIAHAPADLAALVAEVERLREEVERLSREADADDSLKEEDLIEPLKRRGLWNFRERKDA